jgi:ribonuclease Z
MGERRRGRKVVLAGDGAPCEMTRLVAYGADLLVHEATFCEDEAERALETEHSTAREAARVALDANVRLLALTHVSSRYGGGDVEREAREVFPDTVVPRDFDLVEVPFAERGAPELHKRGARQPRPVVSEP